MKGKKFVIKRGTAKNKKYKAVSIDNNKVFQFGAKGYRISVGTKKGDNYCARSYGIKNRKNIITANDFSRLGWNCKGKKSLNL